MATPNEGSGSVLQVQDRGKRPAEDTSNQAESSRKGQNTELVLTLPKLIVRMGTNLEAVPASQHARTSPAYCTRECTTCGAFPEHPTSDNDADAYAPYDER